MTNSTVSLQRINMQGNKFQYSWKIRDWTTLLQMALVQDQTVETVKFLVTTPDSQIAHMKWVIGLKLQVENNIQYASAYCRLVDYHVNPQAGHDCDIGILASFTAQLRKNDHTVAGTCTVVGIKKRNEQFLMDPRSRWNCTTIRPEEFLDRANTLTVDVELCGFELPTCTHSRFHQQWNMNSHSLTRKNLLNILQQESAEYDMKIRCNDGSEFRFHKRILMDASPLFDSMFKFDMPADCTGMIIHYISGKEMNVARHFLYTGELLPSWRNEDVIVKLTSMAEKYKILPLLDVLDDMLGTSDIPVATCLSLLEIAKKGFLRKAEIRIMAVIKKSVTSINNSTAMLNMFSGESSYQGLSGRGRSNQ